MDLYEKHSALRNRFEILAFHDDSVKSLKELDPLLRPIIRNAWKGKPLPFPILLDATPTTHRTNFAISFYPTTILMDPAGRLVKGDAEGLLEKILGEHGSSGCTVASTPGGRLKAVARGNQLKLIGEHSDTTIRNGLNGVRFTALALSADSKTLAAATSEGSIQLWETASGKPGAVLKGHQGPVFSLAFSADARRLVSGGFDTVRLWNLARAEEETSMARHHWPSWAVAFSPDGSTLAAGGLSSVRLFDCATGNETAELPLGNSTFFCRALAFSPDGKTLAASIGRDITTWDVTQRQRLARMEGHGSDVAHLAFSTDGWPLVSISCGKGIRSWNAKGVSLTNAPSTALRQLADGLPDSAEFLNDEAWFALQKGPASPAQYDQALRQARDACRIDPASTNYLQTLGAALYRTGQYEDAIEALRRIDSLRGPGYSIPPAWTYLALAHHKQGNDGQAQKAIARVRYALRDGRETTEPLLRELESTFFGPDVSKAQDRIEGLLDQGLDPGAVLAAIDSDPQVDASARATAHKLMPYLEAERWVEPAYARYALKARVEREVKEASGLSEAARPLALAMARGLLERPSQLNQVSWKVVSQAGLDSAAYALALEQIEAALRLREESGYVNTLGVALYRNGRFKDALEKLQQSQQRNPQGPNTAEDLAFIAMAQHQLGQTDQARQTLDQLRQTKNSLDDEGASFLQEGEELIK